MHGLEAFNLYYGIYRAQVVDVQGFTGGGALQAIAGESDEDKKALLKVRVPAIGDTDETPPRVAYPILPLAGANFGLKNLPPKGSFTWVFFENGNPDIPVWIGGWFRRGEMPERLADVDSYGWITPNGQKLIFDADGNTFLEEGSSDNPASPAQVNIGAEADEAAAKGDTLLGLLEELIDAINVLTVNTVGGPSTPPLNRAQFEAIKLKLQTFLSTVVKVK